MPVPAPGEFTMCRILLLAALLLSPLAPALAQSPAPDAAELTALLNDFLAGAGRGDVAMHDRFWADDLIYTRSAGVRLGKADILRDAGARPAPKAGDPTTVYAAEDVRIQQYGDTAVVAFRLVGTTTGGGKTEVARFLNTGTFVRRSGEWRVVAWQATKIPDAD